MNSDKHFQSYILIRRIQGSDLNVRAVRRIWIDNSHASVLCRAVRRNLAKADGSQGSHNQTNQHTFHLEKSILIL